MKKILLWEGVLFAVFLFLGVVFALSGSILGLYLLPLLGVIMGLFCVGGFFFLFGEHSSEAFVFVGVHFLVAFFLFLVCSSFVINMK